MFQMPLGGDESTAVLKPRPRKLNSGTRKRISINRQKIKSGAKLERERKSRRKERRDERREWLQRRREQGEKKEMLRRERGEERVAMAKPEKAKKLKSKEDERKEKMREKKMKKVLMKGSLNAGKVVPKGKVEKAARVVEPKWNGVRENERHEDRAGKARQEKKRWKSVKERKGTANVDVWDETEDPEPSFPEAVIESPKMDKVMKVKAKDGGEEDQPDLTASSSSEVEQTDSDDEGQHLVLKKTRKYVKREGKQTNPPATSSDEDEEPLEHRRRKSYLKCASPAAPKEEVEVAGISEEIKISSECHTFNNLLAKQKRKDDEIQADLTETSEEEPDEVLNVGGGMRGGAGDGYEDVFLEAIKKSGERLELDNHTRGDGNCGPRALVQQCQRHSVKMFLQRREVTITTFKQLKENVANFIHENADDQRVQDLKQNFELGQATIHMEEKAVKEHLRLEARSWEKYWIDMRTDAGQERGKRWRECWADDIWLGAAALYLNMDIHILRAGDETAGQMIVVEGNWAPAEDKPALYLGYISNAHYQSLIPVPTTENVLAEVVYAMMLQLEQDNQVRFEKL